LAGLIAILAAFVIHGQQQAHERAISESVQMLLDRNKVQQAHDELRQGAITARIEEANHRFDVELILMLVVLGLLLAAAALLVSHALVQPIRRLAEVARRIEAGDDIAPLADSQRDDEIGDLACAFGTLGETLIAMRQRIDHDAAPPVPQRDAAQAPASAGRTMILPQADGEIEAKRGDPVPPVVLSKHDAERQLRLEDDLREAWQRDEMNVVYQPIHALVDGSMRGAEALLRWQHRSDGAISPSEFIPLAERSDLIVALGRHVLVQACSDASLWPSGGTPETTPFLSVNVAARQLHDPHLFTAVVDALRKSGLEASRLHLELPVSALRANDSAIAAMIGQLRGLGVQIWLDATGADAADQSRWLKLPVDGVKVGRSRIAGKSDDAQDAASTGAIVATARALRIVAVVVGVEELAQLNVLREQGCELAQGYVLCRPVSTAEIGRRLLA